MKIKNKLFFALIFVLIFILISCDLGKHKAEDFWRGEVILAGQSGINQVSAVLNTAGDILYPFTKEDGSKFRIGIVISGEYWEFFDSIKGFIEGFSSIGWANPIDIPLTIRSSYQLIEWVSRQEYSDYIEFSVEHFYDLEWGDNDSYVEERIINQTPNVDLFLSLGSRAGRFFYQHEQYPIPVIADAITDPFSAGVTLTETDSGRDFLTNRIDSEQFKNQIRIFHDIVKFNSLGIVYSDDEYGIIYGAVRDIETVAQERGFEIIRGIMEEDDIDPYLDALRIVASRADAFYIAAPDAVTEYDSMPEIARILETVNVPSFSLEGSIRVKDGILFSKSNSDIIRSGIFNAGKAARIFGGALPRSLEQHFENTTSIAVNLETASRINFNVPLEILINADEVYTAWNQAEPFNRNKGKAFGNGFTDYAAASASHGTFYSPLFKEDGAPFRIAIIQSGEYWEYDEHFRGIILGLVINGWAKSNTVIPESSNITQIVRSLGNFSDYIEFPPEYIINLEWGENSSAANIFFADRKPDVDLIIAFGGVAGRLFNSYREFPIPVLMEGITDPLAIGAILSIEDSGKDYVTCRVDPLQYQRQVQLFHDLTGFINLGLIYGDNEDGRNYSAVSDVEIIARRLGFNIIRNTNVSEVVAPNTPGLYLSALRDISTEVDAVYIGATTAITEFDILDDVVRILNAAKIPSFALEGDIRVRQGIMFGISNLETEKFGLYNANKIAAIFHGVSPRTLNQRMEGLPSIIFNLDTAQAIDFQVPLNVLSMVDQIVYQGRVIRP